MVDPYLLHNKDKVTISGYIDQGGATSENNRAYQVNINIFVGDGADMEKFREILRGIKSEFDAREAMI